MAKGFIFSLLIAAASLSSQNAFASTNKAKASLAQQPTRTDLIIFVLSKELRHEAVGLVSNHEIANSTKRVLAYRAN